MYGLKQNYTRTEIANAHLLNKRCEEEESNEKRKENNSLRLTLVVSLKVYQALRNSYSQKRGSGVLTRLFSFLYKTV